MLPFLLPVATQACATAQKAKIRNRFKMADNCDPLPHAQRPHNARVAMRRVVLRSPTKEEGFDYLWAFDSPDGEPKVLRSEWLKKGFAGIMGERRLADDLKPGMEVR